MLSRVDFPLTKTQLDEFILGQEYTNFLNLQQILSILTDADLITAKTIRNRTYLSITAEGQDTLTFFSNRLNEGLKKDIDDYLWNHKLELRNENSVLSDYYKSTAGGYEVHLSAQEKGITLVDLKLSVPLEELAVSICDHWMKKNQEVYQYLTTTLF